MIMKYISSNLPLIAVALLTLVIGLSATAAFGQKQEKLRDFCSDNNWSAGDKMSFRDLRELTVPATGRVAVDAGRNGGVSVKGEDRSDVLVRACIQVWGKSEETIKPVATNVRINTAGTIKAENADFENLSVSYEIHVPRTTDVDLMAQNGGVSITSVDGSIQFETTNGGVFLRDVSGTVKGHTINGGVSVILAGATFKGTGLDVTTTNGGVSLEMPSTYAARVETGTVNGGFKSTIPALNVATEDVHGDGWARSRKTSIITNFNGGGPTIRVMTTNGGIRISSPEQRPSM